MFNENCDFIVCYDMEQYFFNVVLDNVLYEYDYEGFDDMLLYIKLLMFGVLLMLLVEDGCVRLGIWQGIWLGEYWIYGGLWCIVVMFMGE